MSNTMLSIEIADSLARPRGYRCAPMSGLATGWLGFYPLVGASNPDYICGRCVITDGAISRHAFDMITAEPPRL